jgi:hypothetical protein
MLKVEIRISGDAALVGRLDALKIGLRDFTAPLTVIGEELKNYYGNDVFATQGGAIGIPWPTLAASTVKQKLRKYPTYASTPLIRTGKMKSSFRAKVSPVSLEISNDAPYFKYHQSTAPRSKIPYRPMMAINTEVKSIIQRVIQADVDAKVAAA